MSTPTTALVDVVAALKAICQTYITANPTLLHAVYPARPSGVTEVPFAFVGPRNETVEHTSGTRTRTITPTVVIVDTYADNEQTMGRLDVVQDGLMDAFTAGYHSIGTGYGVLEQTGVLDGDISWENLLNGTVTWYRSRTFLFDKIIVTEGRN